MRIAVVSPFLDRRHGTERAVLEQIERLARDHGCEVHLYAQRAEDLTAMMRADPQAGDAGIYWHRVSSLPGPHLVQYVWWFLANRAHRWWDRRFGGVTYELLYSPGINAQDADAISVHIVFHELYRQMEPRLRFSGTPIKNWPRVLHRRLYYRLLMRLERQIYSDPRVSLAAVSSHVAHQLGAYFDRRDVPVIPHGVDADRFSPAARRRHAARARAENWLSPEDFALLLIGNDWRTKGLDALLRAVAACRDLPLKLLVVGTDDRSAFDPQVRQLGLPDRVQFLAPSDDVVKFYAAADAYVGPSLEDAYGLPVLEAMACGLPVIASVRAGVSEIIRNGVNGLLLRNPEASSELAGLIRRLTNEPELRGRLGDAAARTAKRHTWERNAAATWNFLKEAAARRRE